MWPSSWLCVCLCVYAFLPARSLPIGIHTKCLNIYHGTFSNAALRFPDQPPRVPYTYFLLATASNCSQRPSSLAPPSLARLAPHTLRSLCH